MVRNATIAAEIKFIKACEFFPPAQVFIATATVPTLTAEQNSGPKPAEHLRRSIYNTGFFTFPYTLSTTHHFMNGKVQV